MSAFSADRRLFWNCLLLCVPTAVLHVAGIYFYFADLPRIEEGERERFVSQVRTQAEQLKNVPSSADFKWEYGKGVVKGAECYATKFPASLTWKDWPSSGPKRKAEMWGAVPGKGGSLVWTRVDRTTIVGKETEIEEISYSVVFVVAGVLASLTLISMTWLAVRYFRSYVKSRDDYLAATAHDLATPLVGMRFCIGRNDDDARILNERLIRIVENIKDFLRLGGKRKAPQVADFDLMKAYREAYALFRDDYRDLFGGKDVEASFGAGLENCSGKVEVSADETLAVQVLWNLLGNDLKYAAPFGPVRVVARLDGRFAALDFIDEGQGMTPRQMRRAFNRYYRAKSVLQSGKGGFGIGLCTAREATVAMGGTLDVRPNTPHGCIFTLRLPLAGGH